MEIKNDPAVKIDCKQSIIKAVRFNADGHYAMTCGSDRTIKLWRPSKLLELKCYKGHSSDVKDCQANEDSSQFVSCSNDKSIISWDVESGKILRRFRNFAPFNSICYGYEAQTALASSVDGSVRIYDLRSVNAWEPIQSLTEASDSVTCCKVFRHLIFTSSNDKCIRVYDLRNGSLTVDTLNVAANYLSVAKDAGTILVSCVRSNHILLDRTNTIEPSNEGKIIAEYKGNVNSMFKFESTFVMNDSCVASGSEDGKVRIWDINRDDQPKLALEHPIAKQQSTCQPVQSISSDSLDYLLTACGSYMYLWSL